MNWIKEKDLKPPFGKQVLCHCRIYGVFIGSYDSLDPENKNCTWGNWRRDMEFGILPPTHWTYICLPGEYQK